MHFHYFHRIVETTEKDKENFHCFHLLTRCATEAAKRTAGARGLVIYEGYDDFLESYLVTLRDMKPGIWEFEGLCEVDNEELRPALLRLPKSLSDEELDRQLYQIIFGEESASPNGHFSDSALARAREMMNDV